MNANRKLIINFFDKKSGELDHVIKPNKGKSIKKRATKTRGRN